MPFGLIGVVLSSGLFLLFSRYSPNMHCKNQAEKEMPLNIDSGLDLTHEMDLNGLSLLMF